MKKLAILNTTILTADGCFAMWSVKLEKALQMIGPNNTISYVGHESTSQVLTELLGVEVPVNREEFKQAPGQYALCFKLHGRPQEGVILSREDIEKIGYSFKVIKMLECS